MYSSNIWHLHDSHPRMCIYCSGVECIRLPRLVIYTWHLRNQPPSQSVLTCLFSPWPILLPLLTTWPLHHLDSCHSCLSFPPAASKDYNPISSFDVTFAPNENVVFVEFTTLSNAIVEGTETFSAVLSNPPERVTIGTSTATVNIIETRRECVVVCVYECLSV